MEKYTVTVNDKRYIVEFEDNNDLNSIKEVYLDGKKINIDLNFDNLNSIVVDNNTHKINGIFEYDGEPVRLLIGKDSHAVTVEEHLPVKRTSFSNTKKTNGNIVAPLPGKIISVDVNIGDEVEEGQCVLVLEAMKMENKIKAPFKGKIDKINVEAGNPCNARDLLLVVVE